MHTLLPVEYICMPSALTVMHANENAFMQMSSEYIIKLSAAPHFKFIRISVKFVVFTRRCLKASGEELRWLIPH